MKITFLGTGTSTGVPVLGVENRVSQSSDPRDKRLRSSIMIEEQGRVVVDTGPDFRQQMLREGVERLEGVLFTHEHYDHAGGLDDLRPFSRQAAEGVDLYLSAHVHAKILKRHDYIGGESKYYAKPRLNFHDFAADEGGRLLPFEVGGLEVQPIEMMHIDELQLHSTGFVFQGRWAYLTDFKSIKEEYLGFIQRLDLMILGAPLPFSHPTHISIGEAVELINSSGARRGIITHLSDKKLHAELERELPPHIRPAFDSMTIEL